jgi:predicted ATPase/DNA-binding CsgD family transcriptional regulator
MLACCDLATAPGCVAMGQIASRGVSASTRSPDRSAPPRRLPVSGFVDGGNGGGSKVAPEFGIDPSSPAELQLRRGLRRSARSAPLIGRETELAAILRLVADPSVRLVSLVGRGGVGKTRLALEVAWILDAGRPGSVYVVSLASVPAADLVAAEIAAQLQINIPPGLSVVDALARLLQGAPATLVLDNFEYLLAGAGVLTELLDACEDLQLIVTSQASLRLRPERVLRLSPLPVPAEDIADLGEIAAQPAVALYCDRAAAASDQFRFDQANAAAVVSLCRELEGLPLAIELAAARAASLPAAELLTRLPSRRLDVLRATKADAPLRHHDIRAAIGWTYNLLAPAERDLLQRLSVAGAAIDIEDAEALSAGDPADALDALSGLVDVHLVTLVSGDGYIRFELPPSVRDFASEQLLTSRDLAAVENRWLSWLAGRARAAGSSLTQPAPDGWWSWLEGAHDCLRIALHVCVEAGRAAEALDLLSGLAPFWNARAAHPAHSALLDKAIGLAEAQGVRSRQLAETLNWSGLMGLRVLVPHRKLEYIDRLTRGEELARSIGDSELILHALHCRILVSPMIGELDRAVLAADEGLERALRLGVPGWITRFQLHAARFAYRAGDDDRGLALALSAIATAKRTHDTRTVLDAAIVLQLWIPKSQTAAAALPLPAELMAMADATRQAGIQSVLLPHFALRALAVGDTGAAADWCIQGLELSGVDPSSIPAGYSLLVAAQIAAHAGDLELAATVHGRMQQSLDLLYATMDQGNRAAHRAVIERVRAELGPEAFDAAAATGAGLDWVSALTKVKSYLRQVAAPPGSQPAPTVVSAPPAPPPPGQALTRRQLDVVSLLVGGLTNKEIAARLGMTPKTVMHHTVAIYQRLGVRGRSEAVAWAIRAGVASEAS